MKRLSLLSGLPASGKSTLAKKMVSEGWARINRDDLRQLVFSGKWSRTKEETIVQLEKNMALTLLNDGFSVVIDDTNFGKTATMWETFCIVNGVNFNKLFMDVPVEECIRRDLARVPAQSVGRNVITKMAARNGLLNWPDKPIVLVDIDGTLAFGEHREHFVQKEPKDWESYFNLQELDLPVVPIFKWVAELSKDHTIVIVSGRGAEREESTLRWFEKVWKPNPTFSELEVPKFDIFCFFFRDKGDRRPDDIVKLEFLKLLPSKPVLVLDDRPICIRAWRSRGLRCIPVRGDCGEF